MWFRGRTVLSLMTLAAIAAGLLTYAALRAPGFLGLPQIAKSGMSTPAPESFSGEELDKLNKALMLIQGRYLLPTDKNVLLDGAIQGMVEALRDPYSVYKPEDEAEKFTDAMQGAFTGIGAELTIENGAIVVETPIKGSPAERAGLQPRDVLLSVNGQSLKGLTLSEAVFKIRGPKGTKAKLEVFRTGYDQPLELELVRDRIALETVHAELDEDGIGHLRINQFAIETRAHVAEALKTMENKGMKALVIDVRDNPGGMLQSVVEVSQLLMTKGKTIMQYEYRDGQIKSEYTDKGLETEKPYPILVLINKGSASAAEILAGALRQSAGAVLVGETTYGKGTVQIPFSEELGDGSLVKLTVSKWLLPDGSWVNQKGISPDIPVAQANYFFASKLPRDESLKFDSTGEAVKNLQVILDGVGFPADRKDGYFSTGTQSALVAFQQQEALDTTGTVDEATAQRLEEVLYANLQNPDYDKQWLAARAKAREIIAQAR